MISKFNTGPVGIKTFSRSVLFSEVCGCNSPVEQSGECNPIWSNLIVASLNFQGHLYPPKGRAGIFRSKIRRKYDTNVCAMGSVIR